MKRAKKRGILMLGSGPTGRVDVHQRGMLILILWQLGSVNVVFVESSYESSVRAADHFLRSSDVLSGFYRRSSLRSLHRRYVWS